ncbi:glutaredoxin-related protein [uncultured Porphyromonas sp.]|uniref:glutaredoxin-related protein n=1 Tax=uncultured Porphyromonas sp. TaxID=159274 RepID=UPI0026225171|nr:glutaredoxin-related protein [uncultured Porphyromonas sp.]
MIKIYGMASCPDCTHVWEQVQGDARYEVIDFGLSVRELKAFLKLRDELTLFNEAKKRGAVGIPCFVLEDGSVTLSPEEAGLQSRPPQEGATCSLDGSGC